LSSLILELSLINISLIQQPVCLVGETCKAADLTVTVNATRVLREMRRIRQFQQQNRDLLNQAGLKWIEVYYEDLVEDNTNICAALKFLGCGCPALKTGNVQKIIQKPFSELVSNWDDVVATLKNTEFESLLSS